MSLRSRIAQLLTALALIGPAQALASETLDYEALIPLDAEALAEQGMAAAYEALLPRLKAYVTEPAVLEEIIDSTAVRYAIRIEGAQHVIYAPELSDGKGESWGRATYFFFRAVNDQLEGTPVRLYAIGGSHDLGGMFLDEAQVRAAMLALPRKSDWPYIPTLDPPWYGQHH